MKAHRNPSIRFFFLYLDLLFPASRMEDYRPLEKLGSGSFGDVWKALKKTTGEVVAVKKLKAKLGSHSLEDCLKSMEVKALRKLKHPNIVELKEVIRQYDSLFLVFECMEDSLDGMMKKREERFSDDEVRYFCFQILKGLAHMHRRGFFHRDLKPDNLLVSRNTIKIGDLGCARQINSKPPYTAYVGTRWYRAPEVLLQFPYHGEAEYDSAVDMWAMGAIIAEFYRSVPLFRGRSAADQIYQICRVLGSPSESDWPRGHELARGSLYEFPKIAMPLHLSLMVPTANTEAFNLIKSLLNWDPSKRPTASEALKHPFFQSCYPVRPPLAVPVPAPTSGEKRKKESEVANVPQKKIFILNCKTRTMRAVPKPEKAQHIC